MLKKISNSLSTDNSIPIFGYFINEADIASASFFLCRYRALQSCGLSTLLYSRSHFTNKAAAFVTLPSDRKSESFDLFYNSQFCPPFGHAVQKGLSRVQISLFCIRDEQFGRRRGQKPIICTREDQFGRRRGQKGRICTRKSNDGGKTPLFAPVPYHARGISRHRHAVT